MGVIFSEISLVMPVDRPIFSIRRYVNVHFNLSVITRFEKLTPQQIKTN